MPTFGERLKKLRLSRGLKQNELARYIGRAKNTVSQYERNLRQADDDTKKLIAAFFDVTVDYLIGNSNLMHYPKKGKSERQKEFITQRLDDILEKNDIVKPGETLSDEQIEWLMELIDKAIELNQIH